MKRPLARIIAVGAASAVAAVATLVCTAPAFAATKNGNYYFSYGAAYQRIDSLGAEATFSIPQPTVVAPKAGQAQMHSLAEIAVQQLENNRAKNTVEVGWMVGYPGKNDNKPHLFVFRWINGVGDPACYGGCGFVSLASAVAKPGDTIPVGTSINLAIVHRSAAEAGTLGKAGWWIVYGDH